MKRFKRIMAYIVLAIPLLVLSAAVWSWFAPDRIYHCSDDAGSIPLSKSMTLVFTQPLGAASLIFYASPPFVHAGAKMGDDVDHYIWPAPIVWLIWLSFVACAFSLPALVIRMFSRFYERGRIQQDAV
jgi:hypothetical protein